LVTDQRSATRAPSPAGAGSASFFQALQSTLRSRSISVASSRFASPLELGSAGDATPDSVQLAGSIKIDRIECDPICCHPITRAAGSSAIAYFLDGVQYTAQIFRVGHVPVFLTLSVAAILERDHRGEVALMPGSLRVFKSWIMPTQRLDGDIARLREVLADFGEQVLDPLEQYAQPEVYHRNYLDLGQIERCALHAAGRARADMELELLQWWNATRPSDGWIAVDGRLQLPIDRAIGIVKSFTYQHLTGSEAIELFGLPAGQRTSAFVPAANREKTLWYLRMRDADGYDARYGLVRVEIAGDQADPAVFNEISGWLLTERAPRATADSRSDTLLYPIHLLERILKRHVASETRDWPGSR
jgi:hypothetical protein